MFPDGKLITGVPWPSASRSKVNRDYDAGLVQSELAKPIEGTKGLKEVDPRNLHATQPHVTRQGVSHYMEGDYEKTGKTFADQHNRGNQFPVIYSREHPATGEIQNMILSGHHRAAAALVKGEPLLARHIHGPWGGPRNQS